MSTHPLFVLDSWLPGNHQLWSVAPAMPIVIWFVGGFVLYRLRVRRKGEQIDPDLEAKGLSPLLGLSLRRYFSWVIKPLWRLVLWSGIPADGITTLAALLGLGSGLAFAGGSLVLGGWLYILSGILDVFDGRLARHHGTTGPAGAVLDSVLDRYVDAATLSGLAWLFRDTWVLVPCLLGLSGALTVSYIRAKGENLGLDLRTGLMQRPERVLCLGAATVLSPIVGLGLPSLVVEGGDSLAIVGIVVLALSSQWTAAQRLRYVLKALGPGKTASGLGKGSLARTTVVSVLATLADFVMVHALVEGPPAFSPSLATAAGCALGTVVGYTAARTWAFSRTGTSARSQAFRYVTVSAIGLLLNTGGVALFNGIPGMEYHLAWLIVRALIFVLWSYPLQRQYVFGPRIAIEKHSPLAPFAPHGHATEGHS